MRINNNMAAANASRNLASTREKINSNVEKLSTGQRINRAGDDASGLVISNQLRAQVSGLKQASRNAQDGISVLQTAEGALDQVNTMLQRMRDLAVQASNSGTNGSTARAAGQAEITALRTEIDRISSTTKFGSVSLLDGTFGSSSATVGGFDSNNSHTIATASSLLTITFGGASSGLGTVTANLAANTYTSTAMATEIQTKLKAAMLAGTTAATQTAANNVAVTATAVSGGGYTLNLSIGGLAATGTFTMSGTAVTTADATGLAAVASTAATANGRFHVGAGTSANDLVGIALTSSSSTSLGLGSVSVSTDDATTLTSIDTIDTAINTVSAQRGSIGALQNRFESMVANLATTTENLQSSESRIRDVDMAEEMVQFTKNQVLSQAGTAMLAQANQIPQGILSLLR